MSHIAVTTSSVTSFQISWTCDTHTQMPFTSAVGLAKSEFFQAAIDALVMFPDCSSNSSCQKDSSTSQTEQDVLASVSLAPSIQALEQGRLYEAEGHVL